MYHSDCIRWGGGVIACLGKIVRVRMYFGLLTLKDDCTFGDMAMTVSCAEAVETVYVPILEIYHDLFANLFFNLSA